eukprot:Pgem_evm3s9439
MTTNRNYNFKGYDIVLDNVLIGVQSVSGVEITSHSDSQNQEKYHITFPLTKPQNDEVLIWNEVEKCFNWGIGSGAPGTPGRDAAIFNGSLSAELGLGDSTNRQNLITNKTPLF